MVYLVSFWYRADKQLISNPMSTYGLAAYFEYSVTIRMNKGRPQPAATRLVDLCPEAILWGYHSIDLNR
jgi:hypothetical protein